MEIEDVESAEGVVDAPEVETPESGRDESGRFVAKEGEATEVAEPQLDENGEVVAEPAAPDPAAEADKAVADWKPFAVKLHGEEKPLDWANHLDGDTGGIYILPSDIPKFHQMAGLAQQYQQKAAEITQQRRQVAELQRQLESRTKAISPEVAAATHLVERIQKLTALDAAEIEEFNKDPLLYFKLLTRDALDRSKDAQLKMYESARTESTQQWEAEDTEELQTQNIQGWVYQLRNSVPELKALTDTQLNDFIDEVMPAKAAYFVKEGDELKVRNDLLYKQLANRARLLTDAQTRATTANAAKRQNEKVLNKSAAPPTVPAKGSATAAEAQKKPKTRDEWRARVGVA